MASAVLLPAPRDASTRATPLARFAVERDAFPPLAWVTVVVCIFAVVSVLGNSVAEDGIPPALSTLWKHMPRFLSYYAMLAVPATLLLAVVDRTPVRGPLRVALLAGALVVAAIVSAVLTRYVEFCAETCDAVWAPGAFAQTLSHIASIVAFTSAASLVYFTRRRDREFARLLHASELARLESDRARLEASLTAMQARVEPAFLLAALRDVGVLFDADHHAGARMLEALNRYLRTALPRMRETESTVQREVALLQSYVEILALRARGGLAVSCDVGPAAAGSRLAPMLLLPLVAAGPAAVPSTGRLAVRVDRVAGSVRITLEAAGSMAMRIADSAASDQVRERLTVMHGGAAAFTLARTTPDRVRITLEVPHEPADGYPR